MIEELISTIQSQASRTIRSTRYPGKCKLVCARCKGNKMNGRIEPKLRAHFKELARRIIYRDRKARKYGLSQNTIGEITRAIADAYIMGAKGEAYADLIGTTSSSDALDWELIPPRARDTLFSMSLCLSNLFGGRTGTLWNIERVSNDARTRWRLVRDEVLESDGTISHGSVAPLIRLNLLEAIDETQKVYRLSQLGINTCEEFWRRREAGDQTLPIMSLR